MEKSQVISTEINGFFYKIIASLISKKHKNYLLHYPYQMKLKYERD